MSHPPEEAWHKSACILCENNCGIQIQRDGRRLVKIRGDKEHVATGGYTCNKALRLDHYQNGGDRLTTPLRREADGSYTPVDLEPPSARSPSGSRPYATPTAARRSSSTAVAGRATISAAPTAAH